MMNAPAGNVGPALQVLTCDKVDQLLERFRGAAPPTRTPVSSQLRSSLECIHLDLFHPELSVQTIRARCRLRDRRIASRFRHTFGTTIKDDIEMRAACCLLSTRTVTVLDVALSVGYTHPQTFYRVFHRHRGCSPAVDRKRQQG